MALCWSCPQGAREPRPRHAGRGLSTLASAGLDRAASGMFPRPGCEAEKQLVFHPELLLPVACRSPSPALSSLSPWLSHQGDCSLKKMTY